MEFFRRKNKNISEEELQQKIAALSPEMQAEFLRVTDMLLQRESEIFLDIIQSSRQDIRQIGNEIRNEATSLKANEIHKLDSKSKVKESNEKLVEFVEKRQKKKKTFVNVVKDTADKEKEAVENYLKAVGRSKNKKEGFNDDNSSTNFDIPSYARPTTSGTRPGSGVRMRLDRQEIPEEYRETAQDGFNMDVADTDLSLKKEELMIRMMEQDNQALTEKERQLKLIEKKKTERQNKKGDVSGGIAANLMDQSRETHEKQLQQKLQQEKAIQERLEKMRNKNSGNTDGLDERTSTMIEANAKYESQSSIFQSHESELKVRPNTGDRTSPRRSPRKQKEGGHEEIEMSMSPSKGWEDNVGEEAPKKHHKKKKKEKKEKINDIEFEELDV